MAEKWITVVGAREHNLKNISLKIPRERFVVITGISGSGKSSLAFDTIFAEGQRRYVESLSAYARQFLEQLEKPDVDHIEGLPPTIAIEQRAAGANPRSTVATTTELYDYLRLLYARVGEAHCYRCGRKIERQSPDRIVDWLLRSGEALDGRDSESRGEGSRVTILAPIVRGRKGEYREVFAKLAREGFVRVRVDGEVHPLDSPPKLDKRKRHDIEVVVDRIVVKEGIRSRVQDSVELALKLGEGLVKVVVEPGGRRDAPLEVVFSERYACPECNVSLPELEPRVFSFNSPYGACPACNGLGTKLEIDPDLVVPDPSLSIQSGAIEAWCKEPRMAGWYWRVIEEFVKDFGVDAAKPWAELPAEIRQILLYGTNEEQARRYGAKFDGVIPDMLYRFEHSKSEAVKTRVLSYMSELPCPECKGARLRKESLAVRVGGKAIHEIVRATVDEALQFFNQLVLTDTQEQIARQVLKEIRNRLQFLTDVGLGYLTLDRQSSTLAGGEAQRIRLASQVGSGIVGVCYVLDEPTIGLHQRDNGRLISTLRQLQALGNTVLVVEHDEQTIRSADEVIDLGPGAGEHGGRVVARGTVEQLANHPESLTGKYLSGALRIEVPQKRRTLQTKGGIVIKGAREHNLKNIDVTIPRGGIVCVTGVSGSGKSTLVDEILYRGLRRKIYGSRDRPGAHDAIEGAEAFDKVIEIDQSPIGRTPRSNPATYAGVFDDIRRIFAQVREAKVRGYGPGRFSFNVKGGRCEACEGQGQKKIEMHFLPDVYVRCEQCGGRRYNRETLEVRYKGRNIAEVLEMSVEAALEFFGNYPALRRVLETLRDVGLGYLKLGQPSPTLSGGEAQRVKLATELGKRATGRTLYILDEPTTGLHFADIHKLLAVLNRLADLGNTIVIVEHNMEVIKCADYIIDLGPEGGDQGGWIVAEGTPEAVAANPRSYTGRFLRQYLGSAAEDVRRVRNGG